jgi:hypothetical protein
VLRRHPALVAHGIRLLRIAAETMLLFFRKTTNKPDLWAKVSGESWWTAFIVSGFG